MKVLAILITVLAFLLIAGAAHAHRLSGHPKTLKGQLRLAQAQVRHDRIAGDHHWLKLDQAYVRKLQASIAQAARAVTGPSWLVRAFMCIHHYEGSWQDTGDPYWGGLQMDRSFMYTYGSDKIRRFGGFANVWPPMHQIEVAIRAWRSRGFYPWPNTARYCGLI